MRIGRSARTPSGCKRTVLTPWMQVICFGSPCPWTHPGHECSPIFAAGKSLSRTGPRSLHAVGNTVIICFRHQFGLSRMLLGLRSTHRSPGTCSCVHQETPMHTAFPVQNRFTYLFKLRSYSAPISGRSEHAIRDRLFYSDFQVSGWKCT